MQVDGWRTQRAAANPVALIVGRALCRLARPVGHRDAAAARRPLPGCGRDAGHRRARHLDHGWGPFGS
eukprot:2713839-Alexandrium_andersonii.AAC.1